MAEVRFVRHKQVFLTALVMVFVLSGCGTLKPVPITDDEQQVEVTKIRQNLGSYQEPVTGPMDIYEVMARAVKYNLSYRVKMMEEAISAGQFGIAKFSMLPKMTASAGYNHRSNVSAASSESILTNTTSLEPSTSLDSDLRNTGLSFSWNVLDFGVSYFQAKQAADKVLIAEERRRKALHNLIRDVRYAYWRAAAVQHLENEIQLILVDAQEALEFSRTVEKEKLRPILDVLRFHKTLLEVTKQLEILQEELALAKIELAKLMNLPPGTAFELDVPDVLSLEAPSLTKSYAEMEETALLKRPELLEAGYQRRISANETKKAIARLFPGLTFTVSDKWDSNSYTVNNNWIESGVQLAWNLVNLISGPANIDVAKEQEEIANLQQMTLSMAILSQVHIAHRQYLGLVKQYERNKALEKVNRMIFEQVKTTRLASTQSRVEEIRAGATSIMAKLQQYQTYARLQNAVGMIHAAMGLDPLPDDIADDSVETLSLVIRQTVGTWDLQQKIAVKKTESVPLKMTRAKQVLKPKRTESSVAKARPVSIDKRRSSSAISRSRRWVAVLSNFSNIRSNSWPKAKIIGQALAGEVYPVLVQDRNGWCLVEQDNNVKGWIWGKLVEEKTSVALVEFKPGSMITPRTKDGVPVMKGPGLFYDQYGIAWRGRLFQVIKATNNWVQVKTISGEKGWVPKKEMITKPEYLALKK